MKKSIVSLLLSVFLVLTLVPDVQAVKFAVMGDTKNFLDGENTEILRSVVQRIKRKKKIRAVMVMGDLIPDCFSNSIPLCEHYFRSWRHYMKPLIKKTYPIMGNHDRSSAGTETVWQSQFNLPTNGPLGFKESVYAFNKGNSHFIVLNSSMPQANIVSEEQLAWLEQDLQLRKTRRKRHVFVFVHAPPFPVSGHIGSSLDRYPAQRNALWDILERYKVTAVFCGHEHIFNRRLIDNTVYPNATRSTYQFHVGNTTTTSHSAPPASMSEYSYLDKHYVLVNAKKKKIKVDLYSYTGKRIHGFTFRRVKRR